MSKLSYEDKINLYNDRKNGMIINTLSSKYKISSEGIEYLIRIINKHRFDVLRTVKNKYYSIQEKERIINRILIDKEAINSVVIDEGLTSRGKLQNWLKGWYDGKLFLTTKNRNVLR